MATWVDVLSSVGGGSVGSLFLFLGTRYVAASSRRAGERTTTATAQVENRKVDLDEFREFKVTYREELTNMGKRVRSAETRSDRAMELFQEAINHIDNLRAAMIRGGLTPIPLPDILRNARWETYTRSSAADPGVTTPPSESN